MESLGIQFKLFDYLDDQLDTIEERSQECTPRTDLVKQHTKEWGRMRTRSFHSKSGEHNHVLEGKSDDNSIKGSLKEENLKVKADQLDAGLTFNSLVNLQKKMNKLQKVLLGNTEKIKLLEIESTDLVTKVKDIEFTKELKFENSKFCKSTCESACIII